MKIAVISGGFSSEKIVSYKSAQTVMESLLGVFEEVYSIKIEDNNWFCEFQNKEFPIDKNDFSVVIQNQKISFDFVYLIIHGTPAEDGLLAAYFEMLNIPHSSCSPMMAQVTFDKAMSIQLAKSYGIPIAESIVVQKSDFEKKPTCDLSFDFPVFVKACRSGSSFGVSKVHEQKDLEKAINHAFEFDSKCLIEKEMKGTEVTCGVYRNELGIQELAITEVVAHNDFFDFESKYHGASDEITPARISNELTQKVFALAKDIYQKFELQGICRIDFIIEDNKPKMIEINTIPGMTKESFIPQQIHYRGYDLGIFLKEQILFLKNSQ
ncbi:MAG: ATP-grasp domain-containing protein [Flavobacteriales bacterium]|jgi:D-alanine-D-alanine ligase|nr:ATP-grasp domain-containing protein [Flavobacteriales bacterium]